MIKRCTILLPHIDQHDSDIIPFLLSPAENLEIVSLLDDLDKLNSINSKLQKDDIDLRAVRTLFDGTMSCYEEFK